MHDPTLAYYEANALRFVRDTQDVDMDHLHAPFLARLPASGARVLDAGCGSGRDSLVFLAKRHDVTAFDASEAMSRLASVDSVSRSYGCRSTKWSSRTPSTAFGRALPWCTFPGKTYPVHSGASPARSKPGGVLYASFRYGDAEIVRGGRLFSDYREETFKDMLPDTPRLRPIELWRTPDVLPERPDTV